MGYHLTTTDKARPPRPATKYLVVHRKTHGGPIFCWILSSKYTDDETGLLYFGLRFYSPAEGRWLSRDPIGEKGGCNAYRFVKNSSIKRVDVLGAYDNPFPVESLPDMLAAAMYQAKELLLDERGRVLGEIKSEEKNEIEADIEKQVKAASRCCKPDSLVVGNDFSGHKRYGGSLFSLSINWSGIQWGPISYSFWAIGNAQHSVHYGATVGQSMVAPLGICLYSASIEAKGKVDDIFDYSPDRVENNWQDEVYNDYALVWEYYFNQVLGASKPTVHGEWSDVWTKNGWYFGL